MSKFLKRIKKSIEKSVKSDKPTIKNFPKVKLVITEQKRKVKKSPKLSFIEEEKRRILEERKIMSQKERLVLLKRKQAKERSILNKKSSYFK